MAAFITFLAIVFAVVIAPSSAQLRANFYGLSCPLAMTTIKTLVKLAVANEPRMGASLVRLHFHDCFVNGCDGSVLLDDTQTFRGEKTAFPNINSLRGFDLVDTIKSTLNTVCSGNKVSCADILAVAARDSIVELGGESASYDVLLGRLDSTNASWDAANANLPSPFLDFSGLLSSFQAKGLTVQDLVALSGGHSIGFSRCVQFRNRIYNEANIDSSFAAAVQLRCPVSGGDNNLTSFDNTTARFDTNYYSALLQNQGLLHSDQQLFKGDGSTSDGLVSLYSQNQATFFNDFGESMIKMGNLSPPTGSNGEIRTNCRVVN